MTNDHERKDCPECGGKNSYTQSVKDGYLIWNCYHASCDNSGKKRLEAEFDNVVELKPKEKKKQIVRTDRFIFAKTNERVFKEMQKYNIAPHIQITLKYDIRQDRLVFEQADMTIGRALQRDTKFPKWFHYKRSDNPYKARTLDKSDTVVLVEDCLSAAVVANVYDSIALLGTTFKESYWVHLTGYKNVIVALDKDASKKAYDIQKKLDVLYPTRVLLLEDDLKYRPASELKKILDKELKND